MSEEYEIHLQYFLGLVRRMESGQQGLPSEQDDAILHIALLERLERLVAVLEQIRDRLPPEPGR